MGNQEKRKKYNLKYTFSVEGETEKWYLDWLQGQINACPNLDYTVSIVSKVQPSPLQFVKRINVLSASEITHLCDVEGTTQEDETKFRNTLQEMKTAKKERNLKKYNLGYSNLTFELWMILHKCDCNCRLTSKSQYLEYINKAYSENFLKIKDYKREADFHRCLKKLTLDDVVTAISRSKSIMKCLSAAGAKEVQYCGYKYFKENPSLTISDSIERILKDVHYL